MSGLKGGKWTDLKVLMIMTPKNDKKKNIKMMISNKMTRKAL